MQFFCTLGIGYPPYSELFKWQCRRYNSIDMQSLDDDTNFKISYNIVLRRKEDIHSFIGDLNNQCGISVFVFILMLKQLNTSF